MKILYEDNLCVIEEGWNGFIAKYKYDMTPKPKHREWIELQIKIIARKIFSIGWSMKFVDKRFPEWIIKASPKARVRKRDRRYDLINKRKDIDA